MTMNIKYAIISRGEMVVTLDERTTTVLGELNFHPPIFYARINSINNWNPPHQDEKVSEEDKQKIVDFVTKNGPKDIATKITFS
jgi:hypothetical protein